MADKTPVRVVFNASNVATGMAEFQSGDTVGTAFGGTGLTSIGSAGQVLKVNAAADGLEFGAEGDVSITNLVAPSNADLTFTTSGTGNIVLDGITVRGTTINSADSSIININEGVIVDGTLNTSGQATLSGLSYPTSDGTVGQFLKTDGSGTLSFADLSLGDLTIVGSTISVPSNADLTLDPSGSGSIKLNANTDITGNLTVTGTLDLGDSNFTNVGSIQLDSISGDGDTNTSITFSGSDVITIATGGSGRLTIGDGALSPVTTNQIDLGTASLEYKDAFFDGTVTTDAITVSGTSALAETTITTTTTGDSLLLTTTEDSNSAAPVITLKRNSSSPADADYIGRIKFKGENDADQEVQYGSISGKILDASDGTEDGAIEFNVKKAGSNNISMRLNSDELKLLNSTSLDVDGAGTFAGAVTATSVTTNDVVSNGSNADLTLQASGTGDVIISALRINGTTLDSSDSSTITIAEDLTVTGAVTITSGTITGITDLTVADGGTGASSFTDGGILLGSGSDAITATAALADGELLVGDGSGDPVAESGATLRTSIGVGTGDSPQFTGIELGNASDTTITRASAGNLNIEGNLIYRAGGTDVPVADGGTGASSLTATAILLGNGTSAIAASEIKITGSSLSTGDSTGININENLDVGGTGLFSGNVTASADLTVGDDVSLLSDSAVLNFGADSDTKLTHTDGTGLTLNSTNKLTFGDVASFVQQSGDGVLRIDGEATVDINASTAVTVSNDLKLDSDDAVLGFGVNNEITLTHVHNTGLLLQDSGGTPTLQLHDSNESIASDGSKVIITSGGTAFNLPTADGDDGQALITDGSGTLSFGAVGDLSVSDDAEASAVSNKRVTNSARAIDSFGETFQDSVLYYVVTNDHKLDQVNIQKVNLSHNDTGPFASNVGVQSGTGAMTTFTTSASNNIIQLKAASTDAVGGNVSFYKFGLGDNTSAATNGNVIVTVNADVDSASESLVSFAHASFRGAKFFVSVNNDSKTEVSSFEAIVVHDGEDAYITQYNVVNTGDNDLLTLPAAISGSNVVVSAAGLETNLRVTVHAIMLKDTMVANAGSFNNAEAIAPVTISSTATSFDTLAQKTTNGAVYYLVSKNDTEEEFAINEIMVAIGPDDITHTSSGFVSTKGTNQIVVTTEIKADTELTGEIKIASTSGASTTVSGYLIKLHAS